VRDLRRCALHHARAAAQGERALVRGSQYVRGPRPLLAGALARPLPRPEHAEAVSDSTLFASHTCTAWGVRHEPSAQTPCCAGHTSSCMLLVCMSLAQEPKAPTTRAQAWSFSAWAFSESCMQ